MFTRLFSLLLLIAPLSLVAQRNYKEAIIVTDKGDSLKGFINYREWYHNPETIVFKPSLDDANSETFTSQNTSWFTIPGHVSYTRYTVSISMNEIEFGKLTQEADTTSIIKSVFLKDLVKGDRVDLYAYRDKIKERFYIHAKNQTGPQELVYRKTLKEMQEQTEEAFKQQLSAIAIKAGILTTELTQRIQFANYSSSDLKKLASKFNSKNEEERTRISEKQRSLTSFAGIGLSFYNVKYIGKNLITVDRLDGTGSDKFRDQVTTQGISPRFSAGLDFYINRAIRRVVIRTEISATSLRSTTKSYYKYSEFSQAENENTYTFSAWNFSLSPQLIFNFFNTNKNVKAYIGGGAAFNFLKVGENTLKKEPFNQPGRTATSDNDYVGLKKTNLSVIGRLGVQLVQHIDCSFIWSSPMELSNVATGSESMKVGVFGFSVAYLF